MIQVVGDDNTTVALCVPAVETVASSTSVPFGVASRCVNPPPGDAAAVGANDAASSRSLSHEVTAGPESATVPVPVAPTVASHTVVGSMPLYSATRTSTRLTGESNVTVTVFAPALVAVTLLA